MKARASYREAIAWIAEMDSAGDDDALNPRVVSELITSQLVADVFGVDEAKVGQDVVKYRRKNMASTYGTDEDDSETSYVSDRYGNDLPAAQWCDGKHVKGRACLRCGPTIEAHLDHKAVHGT